MSHYTASLRGQKRKRCPVQVQELASEIKITQAISGHTGISWMDDKCYEKCIKVNLLK